MDLVPPQFGWPVVLGHAEAISLGMCSVVNKKMGGRSRPSNIE
jgi:hypothetical protein